MRLSVKLFFTVIGSQLLRWLSTLFLPHPFVNIKNYFVTLLIHFCLLSGFIGTLNGDKSRKKSGAFAPDFIT